MKEFTQETHQFWQQTFAWADDHVTDPALSIHIADSMQSKHPITCLKRNDGKIFIATTTEFAKKVSIKSGSSWDELNKAMTVAKMKWYEEDELFYLSELDQQRLLNAPIADGVRQLSKEDQDLFEAFENRNTETDLDDAGVELDNDCVFGLVENGELVCVADYYLWQNSQVADIGVLTQPDKRGKGLAANVVKALCRHALTQGLVPQYRSQLENGASIGVAKRLGLSRYGSWTVGVPSES